MYMGNHAHGTASEWFAAGITLHELLTGRRPFEAARLQAFRYSKPMSLSLSMPHALSPQLHPAAAAAAEGDCRAYRVQPAAGDGSPPMCSSNHHHDQQKVQPQGQQEKRDQLWPEHLYQHCDYLTPDCKDFVRALLIPDVCVYKYSTHM